ncbi:unnamed protein product [Echinostoma caproni]|uniref:Uncharacterized protein n=1 Tax=Echinostoma caproni TaxID=27848 RepID=A0A3P8HMB8_9TREM|nr:unnamed protein product [Echinostoma caproni]
MFSFELESNGIPNDLKNFTDTTTTIDVDWFDLIDTSDTSGDLGDIQLSPVPKILHSPPEPVQPDVNKSRLACSASTFSTSVPCPTPSRIFSTNCRSDSHQRGRKSSPDLRLKLMDKECRDIDHDLDAIDFHSDDDTVKEGDLSDAGSRDFADEGDSFVPVRSRTGSIHCSNRYLHNEDIVNGRPVSCQWFLDPAIAPDFGFSSYLW